MRKNVKLELSIEEAEVFRKTCGVYLEQHMILKEKVPAIDLRERDKRFVADSVALINEALFYDMSVILECPLTLKWVFYSLAILMATTFWKEEEEHHVTQCMIKCLYAFEDGE